ncbi:MAG TPA: PAS domain S-box protein, partial [Holophaga sp.]|nr:PAS domain S-box protein [Holophaga sp.]
MHKLLAIQLKKYLGLHLDEDTDIPDDSPLLKRLAPFLKAIDDGYRQFDRDLSLSHRSLVISNEELQEAWEREHRSSEQNRAVLEGLRHTAQQLLPGLASHERPELDTRDPNVLLGLMEQLIRERREVRAELEARETQYRSVLESLKEVVFQLDAKGRWQYLNRTWTELTGFTVEESLGQPCYQFMTPEDRADIVRRFREITGPEGRTGILEARCLTKAGGTKWVKVHARTVQGETRTISGTITDISEQKRSEMALLQAQKLESLGVLAGGIAHDFNNLLVAIMGNADLAMQRLHDPEKARHHMKQVSGAIERASELCRQLLAYSGKGRFTIESLDLNALVREMARLLRVS